MKFTGGKHGALYGKSGSRERYVFNRFYGKFAVLWIVTGKKDNNALFLLVFQIKTKNKIFLRPAVYKDTV